MVIPLGQQVDASLHDAVSEAWDLSPEQVGRDPQQRLRRFGEERGVEVLDLAPVLEAHRDVPLYYAHDGHWTPRAHELAARATADRIESMLAAARD